MTLEYAGGVAVVRGSAALLGQMTMNLVHNAIVHNVDDARSGCARGFSPASRTDGGEHGGNRSTPGS